MNVTSPQILLVSNFAIRFDRVEAIGCDVGANAVRVHLIGCAAPHVIEYAGPAATRQAYREIIDGWKAFLEAQE